MKYVAGIDIGNATTEAAIGKWDVGGNVTFLSSGIAKTTGIKGTSENIKGVYRALKAALETATLPLEALSEIRINEAAPVIGDVAMETITETVITESTMIGHNPETPGGAGIGTGVAYTLDEIVRWGTAAASKGPVIALIPASYDFKGAAEALNAAYQNGCDIQGAVVQNDDGVLIANRIEWHMPLVDEVRHFDRIPRHMPTTVEVAPVGGVIRILSNPYGIATRFDLDAEETRRVVPVARALIGNRSAVVIKTPKGDVKAKHIPAGQLTFVGEKTSKTVDVEYGAERVMTALESCAPLSDVYGEAGTNAGAMIERVRHVMATLTGQPHREVQIKDLLAVDTLCPQRVTGGVAGELSMENAVGVAAMVKADRLQMARVAEHLADKLGVGVSVGGVEAEMAVRGALTTPGTQKPVAILDMGAGSTDACLLSAKERLTAVHLAGAGDMVTLLIQTELGLETLELAETLKKYPLAKVESLFHIRHESGGVEFYETPLDGTLFARTVVVKDGELIPLYTSASLTEIVAVRRRAKEKVFVTNAMRALKAVSPTGHIRDIGNVVLVGGSALDFEVPQMVTQALSTYGIVAGSGNIRGCEGPRNAVATGLVMMSGGEDATDGNCHSV